MSCGIAQDGQKPGFFEKSVSSLCHVSIPCTVAFVRTLWYNTAMKNDTSLTQRTTETVTISSAEYERLKRENEQLEGRVRWLEEQLKVLAKNHFGSKHETASEEVYGQLIKELRRHSVYEQVGRRKLGQRSLETRKVHHHS